MLIGLPELLTGEFFPIQIKNEDFEFKIEDYKEHCEAN